MTTFLLNRLKATFLPAAILSVLTLVSSSLEAQNFKGRDGAENYILGSNILNRYTTLAASQAAGSLTVTVTDINELSGAYSFTGAVNPYAVNALSKGDLIMIIQMQGVAITTTDDANYGTITNYNNTGKFELRVVFAVSGNTISLCQNLSNSYTQSGTARTQVIRVPRLTTLNVGSLASITGAAWSGTNGGVVALETSGDVTVDGSITASSLGFRGGIDDKTNSYTSGSTALLIYRTTVTTTTAGKGEGIAGNAADYNASMNGAYGRGAPANAGGGGNGHNSGGGGGSNAGTNGALTPYNGTGLKNISTAAWATAWNFEAANFATDVSTGAGRGGYSYSNTNQDALVLGPGNAIWGGDKRNIVGGFGGRPLNYFGNTRAYMGGGGGAGDGNNSAAGNGGNGGGIVYLLCNGNVSGGGSIVANGQNGYNTVGANIDGAGGGGGGGAIIANVQGTITGVSMSANGGSGGSQLLLLTEAEGPGGGGGGGFISTTATGIAKQVLGGDNGNSYSTQVTEFLPNGATQGAAGTTTPLAFGDLMYCDAVGVILSVKLQTFTATNNNGRVTLNWFTETETGENTFEIQRSSDGQKFQTIATVSALGGSKNSYKYVDNISGTTTSTFHYRLKLIDNTGKSSNSDIRTIHLAAQQNISLVTYPNPVTNGVRVTLPLSWQGKVVNLEMYDLSGKLVASKTLQNAMQTVEMDLTKVSAGLYLLNASSGANQTQQRLVKN